MKSSVAFCSSVDKGYTLLIFGKKVLLRRIGWSYGLLGDIFWDASSENTSAYSAYSSGKVICTSSTLCANLLAMEVFVMVIQWLKKCTHVSQILKDSVIAWHILNIRPNAWWMT